MRSGGAGGQGDATLTPGESLARAAGQDRFGSRGQAELPKHPQLVHDAPVLRNLAVGQLDDMCLRPLRVFSGGGHPKHLALVGPADGHIGSHEVALGDLKVDAVGDVRKSLA